MKTFINLLIKLFPYTCERISNSIMSLHYEYNDYDNTYSPLPTEEEILDYYQAMEDDMYEYELEQQYYQHKEESEFKLKLKDMKNVLKFAIILVMFASCSPNRITLKSINDGRIIVIRGNTDITKMNDTLVVKIHTYKATSTTLYGFYNGNLPEPSSINITDREGKERESRINYIAATRIK